MANPPIEPGPKQQGPKQPDLEQPAAAGMPKSEGAPSKPFNLGTGQVSQSMQTAVKHYLKTGMPGEWKDSSTGTQYKASTANDPNPPKGEKNAQLVTITQMRDGKEVGKSTFTIAQTGTQNATMYSVFNKPGNEEITGLETLKVTRVPNNLGALISEDPKLGRKLYHSLIMGIAMKMMRDMRKKQGSLFKQQD